MENRLIAASIGLARPAEEREPVRILYLLVSVGEHTLLAKPCKGLVAMHIEDAQGSKSGSGQECSRSCGSGCLRYTDDVRGIKLRWQSLNSASVKAPLGG
jgi:hypothetical protein